MPAQRYRKRGWIAQRQPLTAHRLFRGIVNATSCQTSLRFDCARAILTRRRWPAIPSISNGPPRSGRRQSFPEVDRADWFDIEFARTKMLSAQVELLDRLLAIAA